MKASIVDLRYGMKNVLRAIDRGETVTILYRGKPKAQLSPVDAATKLPKADEQSAFGMWKDRKDMDDPAAYVRRLRQNRSVV